MNEKKECKIVQDLLPNYIEKLTSIQTNQYIEQHIAGCNECKKMLENMQKDIPTDAKINRKKEVKYIKKFRNKMRTLSFILLAIFLVFMIVTTRKAIIISNLSQKAEETIESTNYHKTTYTYGKGRSYKTEKFVLGDKKKVVSTILTEQGTIIMQEFTYKTSDIEERHNTYQEIQGKKIAKLNLVSQHWQGETENHNPLYTENIIHLIINSIFANVEEKSLDGIECYLITNFKGLYTYQYGGGMYINKENGLVISSMECEEDNGLGSKTKYPGSEVDYEFGTVTEEDFVEPDISEYEIEE